MGPRRQKRRSQGFSLASSLQTGLQGPMEGRGVWWAAEQTWGARPLGSLQFLTCLWASMGRSVADTPIGEGGSGWHRLRSVMSLSKDSSQATAGAPDTCGAHCHLCVP